MTTKMSAQKLLLAGLCLVMVVSVHSYRVKSDDDKGYVKNCGDAKHNFTMWWSPKVLHAGSMYKIYIDFTPPIDWSSGTATATLWLAGDTTPIYKTSLPADCSIFSHLRLPTKICPFKKGVPLKFQSSNIPFSLPYALPSGKYKIQLSVVDSKGQLFICAEVVVTLQTSDRDFLDGHMNGFGK